MSNDTVNSIVVMLISLLSLAVVFHPQVMKSRRWRATITPLASIIGSGFLVLGPILHNDFGPYAAAVMAVLCSLAFLFGAAIRYNIRQYSETEQVPRIVQATEKISSTALALAYVVSITYYLNLFGSFAVSLTELEPGPYGRIVSTTVIVFVSFFGWTRGLTALENMEEGAVGVKLAIIAGLLVGLGAFAVETLSGNAGAELERQSIEINLDWHSLFVVFGLVITVQGFETSRYLGDEYDAKTRIATMKYAQWSSAAIYLAYIALMSIGFFHVAVPETETAIVDMTRAVAPILPAMLVFAALAAQFSAAVADTSGCGGLVHELTRGKLKPQFAYVMIGGLALALTWSANVFSIISYASKAFAAYYAIQSAIAAQFAWKAGDRLRTGLFAGLAVLAVMIAILGVSPE